MATLSSEAFPFISSTSVQPFCFSSPTIPQPYPPGHFLPSFSYYPTSVPCFTVMTDQHPVFLYFTNASVFFSGIEQQLSSSPPSLMLPTLRCDKHTIATKKMSIRDTEIKLHSSVRIDKEDRSAPCTGNAKEESLESQVGELRRGEATGVEANIEIKSADQVETFELDCYKTTVMIKNIPNKFTGTLLKVLDEHCKKENQKLLLERPSEKGKSSLSAYDFVYLPIDFGSKRNKGYAFVNFTEPSAASKFHLSFNNHKWRVRRSKKICEITYARIQGKDAVLKHFQNTTFACETKEYLPVYFEPRRDGSGEAVEQCVLGELVPPFEELES